MLHTPAGWVERASADNALGTATRAAVAGKAHIIYGVSAAFSTALAGKLLTIKDGTTVKFSTYVYSSTYIPFLGGIRMTVGNAVSAELATSGTGGQIGDVCLHGTTV